MKNEYSANRLFCFQLKDSLIQIVEKILIILTSNILIKALWNRWNKITSINMIISSPILIKILKFLK